MRLLHAFIGSYAGIPKSVKLLALAMFVNRCGGLVAPFLAIYLRDVATVSQFDLGVVLALHGAGGVLGAWLGGILVSRLGPKPVQVGSLVSTALLMVALTATRDLVAIGGLLALLGVSLMVFWPAQTFALIEASEGDPRRALALNRVAIGAAWLVAPVAGGVMLTHNPTWLFMADAATCLAGALLLLNINLPSARNVAPTRPRSARRIARAWKIAALAGLVALAYFQLDGPLQVYWRETVGLSELNIGFLLALNGAIIVVAQIPLTSFASRFPPLPSAAVGALLIGMGFGVLPWLPGGWLACVAGFTLFTVGEMVWFPAIGAYVAEEFAPSLRARTLGAIETAYSLGRVGAPILSMFMFESIAPDAPWYAIAVMSVLVALGLFAQRRRAASPARRRRRGATVESIDAFSQTFTQTASMITDTLAVRNRVFFDSEVSVVLGGVPMVVHARDLAQGGIGLTFPDSAPDVGQQLEVDIVLGEDRLRLPGTVVWAGESGRVGVEFNAIERLSGMRIGEYIWAVLDQQFEDGDTEWRMSYEGSIEVSFDGREVFGRGVDVSRHGLSLKANELLPIGTSVDVRIRGLRSTDPISVQGTIIWSRPEGTKMFRTGVRFESVGGEAPESLEDFLQGKRPRPRGAARLAGTAPALDALGDSAGEQW